MQDNGDGRSGGPDLERLISVVALPISMWLCDPRVAATQFTLHGDRQFRDQRRGMAARLQQAIERTC
jgi:hypothetical protein